MENFVYNCFCAVLACIAISIAYELVIFLISNFIKPITLIGIVYGITVGDKDIMTSLEDNILEVLVPIVVEVGDIVNVDIEDNISRANAQLEHLIDSSNSYNITRKVIGKDKVENIPRFKSTIGSSTECFGVPYNYCYQICLSMEEYLDTLNQDKTTVSMRELCEFHGVRIEEVESLSILHRYYSNQPVLGDESASEESIIKHLIGKEESEHILRKIEREASRRARHAQRRGKRRQK